MRTILGLLMAAAVAVSASGCNPLCLFSNCVESWNDSTVHEFFSSLDDYETNAGGRPIGLGVGVRYGQQVESPEALAQALEEVELRDSAGNLVPSRIEVLLPANTGVDGLGWCDRYYDYESAGTHCASVTPKSPLAEGWYTLNPGPGLERWSQGKQVTLAATHFHVGSKPMIVSMYLSTKGGLTGAFELSEAMLLTRMDEFISIRAVPGPGKCWRWISAGDPTIDDLRLGEGLMCDFSIDQEVEVVVKPGLVSPSGAPLQDYGGNAEFTFRLGPREVLDAQTNLAMRKWQLGNRL
ncbi:MAG TPA: hypothetical protein VGK67_30450 [Myxococcales bacterium]|jgi:hypothetical protein